MTSATGLGRCCVFLALAISGPGYAQEMPSGSFQLVIEWSDGETQCLQGDGSDGMRGGAAFMAPCEGISDQFWMATPIGNGYFQLTTETRRDAGDCLEGNQPGGDYMGGAAFLHSCTGASGEAWVLTEVTDGAFWLATMFREPEGECLAGNYDGDPIEAAHMDSCMEARGQLWRLRPVADCTASGQLSGNGNGQPVCPGGGTGTGIGAGDGGNQPSRGAY